MNPTRSANSTDTTRRSRRSAMAATSADPQPPQNRKPSGFSTPHCGQTTIGQVYGGRSGRGGSATGPRPPRSFSAADHRRKLVQRVADEAAEIARLGLRDPALERGPKDGDTGIGGQVRRRWFDAARAQRLGQVGGQGGVLDLLALLQARVAAITACRRRVMSRRSSSTAPAASRAAVTASIAVIDAGASATVSTSTRCTSPEHDLALVGEVAVERPLGESGRLGDLRHGGLIEAVLAVELEGRLAKTAACPGSRRNYVYGDDDFPGLVPPRSTPGSR